MTNDDVGKGAGKVVWSKTQQFKTLLNSDASYNVALYLLLHTSPNY